MPPRVGLYEKSLPETLPLAEKLRLAKSVGYDYIELSVDESDAKLARLDWTGAETDDFLSAMRREGIRAESLCLSGHRKFPLGSRDKATREESLNILKKAVRLSAVLGIRIIQLAGYDVYYEKSGDDTEKYYFEGLSACVSYAASYGVILAFETMETPFMNTVQKAMNYVNRIGSPYLQVYPDIGNVRNATDDYLGDLNCGRGHIAAAHLKETVAGVFRDMQFGEGRVDFKGCIDLLKTLNVNMFVTEFWYDKKSEPLAYIQKSRKFFEELL